MKKKNNADTTAKIANGGSKNKNNEIELPKFQLDGFDPDRHELWSVRLPADLPLKALDKLNSEQDGNWPENSLSTTIVFKGRKGDSDDGTNSTSWHFTSASETSHCRLFITREDDDQSLYPVPHKFDRHVTIVPTTALQEISDLNVAPPIEQAPSPVEDVRHAYAPVPQKQHLKRRWKPLGAGFIPKDEGVDSAAPSSRRKRTYSEVSERSKSPKKEHKKKSSSKKHDKKKRKSKDK